MSFTGSAIGGIAHQDELDMYVASTDTSDKILDFWQQKAAKWPRLSSAACTILAIPATKTSSERVFSLAGHIVEDRHTQLSADAVNNRLFVHELNVLTVTLTLNSQK